MSNERGAERGAGWEGWEYGLRYVWFSRRRRQTIFFFKQKAAYEVSACLVGSEMCIRDRRRPGDPEQGRPARHRGPGAGPRGDRRGAAGGGEDPVSYTHLTPPTKRIE
ncbi:hypothetical protein CDFC105_93854 [Clostridioides difficile]|nr:hypothetical protein CDFC105_93854 [Clostridioides difficile]